MLLLEGLKDASNHRLVNGYPFQLVQLLRNAQVHLLKHVAINRRAGRTLTCIALCIVLRLFLHPGGG